MTPLKHSCWMGLWANWSSERCPYLISLWQGDWTGWFSKVSSDTNHSMILWREEEFSCKIYVSYIIHDMDLLAIFQKDLHKCSHLHHTRTTPHLKLTLMKPLHHCTHSQNRFLSYCQPRSTDFQRNPVTCLYLISSNTYSLQYTSY